MGQVAQILRAYPVPQQALSGRQGMRNNPKNKGEV